ncbi:sigma-54 interaction domain-containing protein [Clostridium oceanicum]|uniref:Uncharacterized protein n=1 Tax=Clostridium oceanicum TaxID=1543 RepID=A0ABN1J9B7_9CLOT
MKNTKDYDCLFSQKYILKNDENKTLYNYEKFDLLKDCFNFAIENIKSIPNEGLLILSTERGYLISAYDFKNKSLVYEYEGMSFKEKATLSLNIHIRNKEINMVDENKYVLHFISNEKLNYIENMLNDISKSIEGIVKISRKHSYYGDMLLKAIDNVDDAITYCDKNGIVRYANKGCLEILDTNKEDVIGKDLREITTGKPILLEVLKNKKSIIDIEYILKYRGKAFRFINSGYPVYSDKGEILGAIDIYRTIERSRKFVSNMAGYQAFFSFDHIIGEDRKTVELLNIAKIFAKSDETILILGESGTGKELIAQSIHNYSNRKDGPFIALNCANFPNDLIDSELFGYSEGAFTGAKKGGKQGKFELASGGTLFLDEIGEMQIHLQAKLLRVLETKCITRIGGNNQVKIDVRIIAATNKNLEKLVEEGKFRRDLYYRLKVLCLETPNLRERGNDIILLAEYFIRHISSKLNKKNVKITDKGKDLLLKYSWPGNIRELENAMSRALFICDTNLITEETLIKAGIKDSEYHEIIKRDRIKINRQILIETMKKVKGNKKKAAEKLGISRPTLYKMLKRYDLD